MTCEVLILKRLLFPLISGSITITYMMIQVNEAYKQIQLCSVTQNRNCSAYNTKNLHFEIQPLHLTVKCSSSFTKVKQNLTVRNVFS